MTLPRVLAFCRPYLVADFERMLDPLKGALDVTLLTDGRGTNAEDTCDAYYKAMDENARCRALTPDIEDDIIQRCRMARCLPRPEALRRIHAMALVFETVMDRDKPQAVFAHTVDEYGLACLCHLARLRGLPFIGYYAAYFPGLVSVTLHEHGAPFMMRNPEDAEVDAVLDTIRPTEFRVDYNLKLNTSILSHTKGVARHWAKRVYFGLKGWRERDPLNMHYCITPYLGDKKYLSWYPRSEHFSRNWRQDLAGLRSTKPADAPVTYHPLSFYPEASTEYWVRDRRMVDYEAMTLEILRTLTRDGIVLLKEHPHMMGIRDPKFHAAIAAMPGVISIPPTEQSNAVLAEADLALLGAGSVGVEATVRGKPVLSFSDTSYWYEASRAGFVDLANLQDLPDQVRRAIAEHQPMGPEDLRSFIRSCLASTAHQRDDGVRWPIIAAEDMRSLLLQATGNDAQDAQEQAARAS